MSLRFFQNLSCACALILVAALQVSGGVVRYLCLCTGDFSVSVQEHCHGDDGLADHHHGAPGHRHADGHSGDRDGGDDPVHRHQPVATPTLAVPISVVEIPAIPCFHSVIPSEPSPRSSALAEKAPAEPSLRPPWLRDDPPPTHLLVTRSVVRVI